MRKPSSGFTENIDTEVNKADEMSVDKDFHDIKEIYVSQSGQTRILSATRYGKRYALKALKPDFLYTPVYRQALAKEFDIGLRLDHPNICRTIGMEDLKDYGPTIIMEYVDGMTLYDLMQTRQFTKEIAHKITRQLLDALEYMHSKQIYHRDLKPQNIMVTYGANEVKVIDFSLSDSEAFSVLKSPAGTMGYIAPEQLQHGAKADARADIFSFGKVVQDMALTLYDNHLMRLGKLCAQDDPMLRPANIAAVRQAAAKHKGSRVLTVFLLILIAFFAFCIVTGIQKRSSMSQRHPAPQSSVQILSLSSD